jgi:flagellar assembly factor FliW
MTACRTILSPWIGEVEWEPGCELLFPNGLPGFEEERQMLPVEIPAQRPIVYLQSLESQDICFVCLPVLIIDPAFQLDLSDEEKAVLRLPPDGVPAIGTDVLCLGLLMPSQGSVEVNLRAPVVINLHNARGIQCVASDYKASFRLDQNGIWTRSC